MHKYQEALGPLDEAIKVAGKTRGAAYPTIAVNAKIDALSGLGKNKEALALAAEELRRVSAYHLAGHLYELYQQRAGVYERMGQWDQAVSDYSAIRPVCEAAFVLARADPGRWFARKGLYPPRGIAAGAGRHQ